MKKMNEKELEQLIHTTLRSLPDRKAPGTLEARVLAALEQRSAVAWYHRSWAHWPAAVRAAFLAVATAVGGGVVFAFYALNQGVDARAVAIEASARFEWVSRLYGAGLWCADLASRVVSTIPSLWVYGALAAIALVYASFFGLGAAAYRALYRNQ